MKSAERSIHKVCDLSYLEEVTDGDKAFMGKMINTFLEQVSAELNRLQEGSTGRNAREVQQVAPKLKFTVSL